MLGSEFLTLYIRKHFLTEDSRTVFTTDKLFLNQIYHRGEYKQFIAKKETLKTFFIQFCAYK